MERSVASLLERAGELRRVGWDFALEASLVEVYNESVRDLLSESGEYTELKMRQDEHGQMQPSNLTRTVITDSAQVASFSSVCAARRTTAATAGNSTSSRSHCVLIVRVEGTNTRLGRHVCGTLFLVDLAGSEPLVSSNGSRSTETKSINRSLSALSDVFNSLSQHKAHIPFRNSKLTLLLQPCFTPQGKVQLLLMLSPAAAARNETMRSLRFGQLASTVELRSSECASTVVERPSAHGQTPRRSASSSTVRRTPQRTPQRTAARRGADEKMAID